MKSILDYKWIVICVVFVVIIVLAIVVGLGRGKEDKMLIYENVSQDATEILLTDLIATPEKYDGKLVCVVGVGTIGFECNSLYASKKDYKEAITQNAVWIDIDEETLSMSYDSLKKLNGKKVLVEGVYNSKRKGHFSRYSGTIEKITRYKAI